MLREAKKEDSVYVKRIIIRKKSRWAIIRPYLEALLLVFIALPGQRSGRAADQSIKGKKVIIFTLEVRGGII